MRAGLIQLWGHHKRLLLFILFLCVQTVAHGTETVAEPVNSKRSFLWEEATARMCAARSTGDFLAAAEAYQALVQTGVRNRPVFFNLGVALMAAEEYPNALDAFLKAERFGGSNEDIRRNIRICRARISDNPDIQLPFRRTFLFWHYDLALHTRITLLVILFSLFWIGFIWRLLGARRLSNIWITWTVVLWIAFAASVSVSIYQEKKSESGNQISEIHP